MPVFYLETSAILKRYKSEKGSDVVTELIEGKRTDETFVTSHLSVFEVNCVAARLLKGRLRRRRQYETMIGTFVQDISKYGITVLPLQDAIVSECIELLPAYTLRTADALHFATAIRIKRALGKKSFYMVSTDKDIVEACARYQLDVFNPESDTAVSKLHAVRSD